MFRTESPREGLKDGEDVDVSTGVSQLANFGSILSSTLGAFNKNIHRLEEFQNKSGASLSDIGHKFESQRKIINDLGVEVEDIKLNVDEILRKIQLLEREIASRIDDSNAHMQKEIMVQRTTAKIELNNMKQSIHNSMNETLELFARLQGDLNKNPITAMTGLSDNEMVAKIAERLGKIESALSVQSRFNEQMSRAVENDGLMQLHSFEAVHQQISALETSLKQTKTENYNLKVALEDVKTQLSKALKGQSRGSRPDSAVAVLHPGQESVLGKLEEVGQALADGLAARIPVNGVVIDDDTVAITPVEMGHMSPPESKVELVQEVVHVADEGLLRRIDDIESMLNTIQEELRTQRHGFGSRFEKMECSLDLFSDTNNAGIREVAERLTEIQDIVQTFSGSSVAIKRLQMAMNDVIADVDELKFQQNNREPEDINDVLQRVGTNGSSDGSSGSGFNLSQQLATVKQKWREFREDLDNGLDYFADVHASDPEGSEALESVFIHRLAAFADRLDSVLFAFDQPSGKSPNSVLDTLFQPLDALTVEVDTLMELDRVGRTSMGITFDDVTNNKSGGKNIRDELRKVYEASLPLLDQRVDKITMRRRIQRLENLVVQKSDKTQMAATEQELRRLLAAKADQQDFLKVASKKVSLGEMAQFKDQVMKQIIALRGYEYERVPFSPDASTTSAGEGMMAHAEHKIEGEVKTPRRPGSSGGEMATHVSHLSERFDILHKRHQELTTQCTTYVPREEVEQALQAILAEMRQMKNNSISPDVLKESLQTKANAAEVQRLIDALSFALGGDLSGKGNASAAIHSRCLVCDKPVRTIVEHTNPSSQSPERMRLSTTSNQSGMFYEKSLDADIRPQTMTSELRKASRHTVSAPVIAALPTVQFSKSVGSAPIAGMGSPSPDSFRSLSQKDLNMTKISTEVTVMRSSIDLPPLSDGLVHRGANKASSNIGNIGNIGIGGGSNFKQRVRSSAGGGSGPNYAIDTR